MPLQYNIQASRAYHRLGTHVMSHTAAVAFEMSRRIKEKKSQHALTTHDREIQLVLQESAFDSQRCPAHTKERILWESSVRCLVMCTRLRSSLDNSTSQRLSVLMTAKATSEEQRQRIGHVYVSLWRSTTLASHHDGNAHKAEVTTALRLCSNLHDFPSRWEISSHTHSTISQIELYVTSKARSRCWTDLSRQATTRRELGIGSTLPCDSREEIMRYQEAPNEGMEK